MGLADRAWANWRPCFGRFQGLFTDERERRLNTKYFDPARDDGLFAALQGKLASSPEDFAPV